MIRRLLISLLLCLPFAAQAAGPEGSLKDGQVLRGHFVQERHLQGFNAPLKSEGSFVLAPGQGLIWKAEKPFAVTTIISPAGLVQEVGGNQTMHLASSRLPFLSRLYDMLGGALGGDWRALEKDFQVAKSGDAKSWQVVLTPKAGSDPVSMPFRSIATKGSRFVDGVRIAKAEGDYDDLSFLDQALSDGPLSPEESTALAAAGK